MDDDTDNEPSEERTKYTIRIHVCYQNLPTGESESSNTEDEQEDEQDVMEDTIEFDLDIYAWTTVPETKALIQQKTGMDPKCQRLFYRGCELLDARTLSSHRMIDSSRLWLQQVRPDSNNRIVPYGTGYSKKCRRMIAASNAGLAANQIPQRIEEGEGGSYRLTDDTGSPICVFKPRDEETGAKHNPKGNCDTTLRAGILPETGHLREVAAYLLDSTGFHCVPPTVRCEMRVEIDSTKTLTKIGSLQKFIIADDIAGNLGPPAFSVREVHKIGILDIRILNNDRNDANILVCRDDYRRVELIPIDHGLSIPETIEISDIDWIWWKWPQAKQPFDPFTKNVIRGIRIEDEMNLLRMELGISERALDNLRIAHMVLLSGMEAGLNLYEIAGIILRQKSLTAPSILENLCEQAEKLAQQAARQARYNARSVAVCRSPRTEPKTCRAAGQSSPMLRGARTPNFAPLTAPHSIVKKNFVTPIFSAMTLPVGMLGTASASPPPPRMLLPSALSRSSTDPATRSMSVTGSPYARRAQVEVRTSMIATRSENSSPSSSNGAMVSTLLSVIPPPRIFDDSDEERDDTPRGKDPDELFMGPRLMFESFDLSQSPALLPVYDATPELEDGDVPEPLSLNKMERSQSCVDLGQSFGGLSLWRSSLPQVEEKERAMTDDSFTNSGVFDVERFPSFHHGEEEVGNDGDGIGRIIGRLETEAIELKKHFFTKLQEAIQMFCETHARKSGAVENSIFDTDTAVGRFVWLNEQRKLLEGRNVLSVRRAMREEEKKNAERLMIETNPIKNGLIYEDE